MINFNELTLDQLVDLAVNHAKTVLIGRNDVQLDPIFHIEFKDRPPAIILAPWTNEHEKATFIRALRLSLKSFHEQVVSYSFVSEAWQAHEDTSHPTGLPPSKREDRREVVLITAAKGRDHRLLSLEISRDDKGRVTALTNNDTGQPDHVEGRLFNLLEDDE